MSRQDCKVHLLTHANLKSEAQFSHVFETPDHAGDHLVYALLGISQHYLDAAALQGELDKRKGGHSGTATVLTSSDFISMLGDPNIVPKGESDYAELAVAYRRLLTTLHNRFEHFAGNPVENWNPNDYVGAFASCRKKIPSMKGARIGYATFPGKFHYCAWG
ncbi:MAG: hypothetical protein NTW96_27410, partial [Planctomycetia bacterium]|nr:hypothetical protein [Planctomycetia bacterium]